MKYFLRYQDDYLEDSKEYPRKSAAIAAYVDTATELWRYGQTIEASIHIANSRDDLVEYPDYVLSFNGKRVKVEPA